MIRVNVLEMDIKRFKKLITHDDFDGIVSAVLLTTINPNLEIEFHSPDEIRGDNKNIKIDNETIITDLPYDDRCGLWFDHHKSNKGKGFHEIAPSAARVIYNTLHLRYPELFRYEDLVEWCDKIDTARYSKNDILNPEGYVLLGFTLSLDEDEEESIKYRLHVINLLRKLTIDDILNDKIVKSKVNKVLENLKHYLKVVREKIKVYENLFYVVDMRGIDVDAGIKFVAHTLYDNEKIGVFLKSDGGKVKFSISYNYLYRETFEPVDLSKVAKYYGGGGHPRAAGFTIDKDKADSALEEIINLLKKVDWQPR